MLTTSRDEGILSLFTENIQYCKALLRRSRVRRENKHQRQCDFLHGYDAVKNLHELLIQC